MVFGSLNFATRPSRNASRSAVSVGPGSARRDEPGHHRVQLGCGRHPAGQGQQPRPAPLQLAEGGAGQAGDGGGPLDHVQGRGRVRPVYQRADQDYLHLRGHRGIGHRRDALADQCFRRFTTAAVEQGSPATRRIFAAPGGTELRIWQARKVLPMPGAPSMTTLIPVGVRRRTAPSTRSRAVRSTVTRSDGDRWLATSVTRQA